MTDTRSALAAVSCRAIVQCLPHAIVLLDHTRRIALANRAASRLFRTAPDRLIGRSIDTFVPDEHLASLFVDSDRARTRVIETLLPAAAPGCAPATVRISAVPISRLVGVPDGRRAVDRARIPQQFTLLTLEDISEKAALEQQLVDSEKQVAMGQLAAGILHEVTNPIAAIGSNLVFVRSALDGTADAGVNHALDLSIEQLDQMRQLLGTLSGFPSRHAPRYQIADVHEVVRRSVAFVAKEAERRRLQVFLSFAPSALQCEMDVRMIKQVLLNLLKNAMEAMPEGGRIEVKTSQRPETDDMPAAVVITIADTGVGIPEADVRRVFRPLFSTKPRGAGLGLSFCRQVVEEHGGEIRLSNRPRQPGAIATLSLPVHQTGTNDD